MKRSIYCLAIMLIVTTVLSCSQGRKVEKPFGPARNVTAEPILIDELLKIDNIVKLEDFIVLQNGSEGVEDFFFVYSYPEMKFLYSFAKRGRGPMDYMMPAVIKNIPGNILAFKDHFTDKVSFYELSEESARLKRTIHFSSPDKDRFFWELNQVED